jgi:chaperonin GroES
MKLRPLQDKILLRPSKPEEVTKGGIIIPGNAKEKPTTGEVLAVGTGRVLPSGEVLPMDVRPGNVVIYGQYAGTEVELDGEKLRIINQDDVLGVEE